MGTHPIFESDFDCLTGKMSKIELVYFPVHGFRGLLTRLVLQVGDLEFDEKIITMQEWIGHPETKSSFLLGKLPVIMIGGVQYCQTSPIVNYLSKIGSMDKLNELEELRSNMVLETATEGFLATVMPAFNGVMNLGPNPTPKPDLDREEQVKIFHRIASENGKKQLSIHRASISPRLNFLPRYLPRCG